MKFKNKIALINLIVLVPISVLAIQIPFGFFRKSTPASPLLTAPGSSRTEADCTASGGVVVSGGGYTMCKFSAATCGGGWTQYESWSRTSAGSKACVSPASAAASVTCMGQTRSFDVSPAISTTMYSGSHSWSNTAVEVLYFRYLDDGAFYWFNQPDCSTTNFSNDIVFSDTICGQSPIVMARQWHGSGGEYAYYQRFATGDGVTAVITEIGCK